MATNVIENQVQYMQICLINHKPFENKTESFIHVVGLKFVLQKESRKKKS